MIMDWLIPFNELFVDFQNATREYIISHSKMMLAASSEVRKYLNNEIEWKYYPAYTIQLLKLKNLTYYLWLHLSIYQKDGLEKSLKNDNFNVIFWNQLFFDKNGQKLFPSDIDLEIRVYQSAFMELDFMISLYSENKPDLNMGASNHNINLVCNFYDDYLKRIKRTTNRLV